MVDDIEHLKVNKIEQSAKANPLQIANQDVPAAPPPEIEETVESGSPRANVDTEALRELVIAALKTVHDPEIPLNIYDLGLIYNVEISQQGEAEIAMTLTAPGCPVADMIVRDVAHKVGAVEGICKAHVKLVWDPPWTKARMSEEALLELGLL